MKLVMRKHYIALIFMVFGFSVQAQLDDLMLVEYLDESSGSGVVVKIYNPTPSPINMSGYVLSGHNNGNLTNNGTINLSGTLAPGDVYVVKGGGSSCPSDANFGSNGVNGNDCIRLSKGGQNIDMINLYGTSVSPRIGSVSNGLFQKKIVRTNNNCIRYTSTDGTSINSWPNNSTVAVQGWIVSAPNCLALNSTSYNPTPAVVQQSLNICQGDSVFIGGAYRKNSGTFYDTLSSQYFCDSIYQTNLLVLPKPQRNENLQICQGDSVFLQNSFRKISGIYRDTIVSGSGCDTVVVTNLQVLSSFDISNSIEICNGDSVLIAGTYRQSPGLYRDTLQAQNSCDSIITTQLNVLAAFNHAQNLEICAGDSVFLGGEWRKSSGNYVDTLQTTGGCDSVITTALNLIPIAQSFASVTICNGDSLFIGGAWRKVDGNYRDTLVSASGCDSIVTTRLTIDNILQGFRNIDLCQGDSIFLQGAWQNIAGTYRDTLAGTAGCDSVINTQLTINPLPQKVVKLERCAGDSILINGLYLSSDTSITISKPAFPGLCDSIVTYQLDFEKVQSDFDFAADQGNPTTIVFENFSIGNMLSYTWDFGDGSGSSQESPGHTFSEEGTYQVSLVATSDKGCSDTLTRSVTIFIEEPLEPQMEVPNVFTPNGDGINDFFTVAGQGWPVFSISIYNRWGGLVYQSNDLNFKWDGKHNGNDCAAGTYMYLVEGTEILKGFLTLSR